MLQTKLRQVAYDMAVDLALKNIKKDPSRCARNLTELTLRTFPEKLSQENSKSFFLRMSTLCKSNDTSEIRAELRQLSHEL